MLGEIRYKGNKKMSDLSRKMLVFNKIELLFRHNNGCQQEILQLDSIEGCSLIRIFCGVPHKDACLLSDEQARQTLGFLHHFA